MNKLLQAVLLLALPLTTFAQSSPFGRVVDVKGSGFISYNGKTSELRQGDVIYADSEIFVESTGQVTFTDNADHRFHLSSSTSIAVYASSIELRNGDVWVQSLNKLDDYQLISANAKVNYQGGEAIFSYDEVKGKSQLMVINGLMKLSNLRVPELNLTVAEGNFSFVDLGFEEGMPRDPTFVGEKSYNDLVATFAGVSPMDSSSINIFKDNSRMRGEASGRALASVSEVKKETAPVVAVVVPKASVVTKSAAASKAISKVEINFYGREGHETSATTAIYDGLRPQGAPAMMSEGNRMPASAEAADIIIDHAIEKIDTMKTLPLNKQYKESDKLIEQLRNL